MKVLGAVAGMLRRGDAGGQTHGETMLWNPTKRAH